MADHQEYQELTRAFSGLGGLGVDEPTLVSTLEKWRKQPQKRTQFRKSFSGFFKEHGGIEKCEDDYVLFLETEFSRFKNLMVLWAMHPWERDARWAYHVLHQEHPSTIIVEIACTRSSEELLGARKAYQALFHHSLEEDVAYTTVKENHSNLLVGLVSAYRYEGPKVNEELAKSEAKIIGEAVKSAGSVQLLENPEVIRILTTRSKLHLRETLKYYKEMYGKHLEEELNKDECLRQTLTCLVSPAKYFSQVIDGTFKEGADTHAKTALSRVMVSRSDVDMEEIKEAYKEQYSAKLEDTIANNTHGYYKSALLSLVWK